MQRTASTHRSRALDLLRKRGLLRSREFVSRGIPRSALRRLVEEGKIERVARGLYRLPGPPVSQHQSLLEVSKQVPSGVVCLLSALAFHGIGTQLPHEVWIAVPAGTRQPVVRQVAVRVVRFSHESYPYGVESRRVDGVELRVTSPAKTVADCFKFRNKIGIDVAVEALREGWRERRFDLPELRRAARVCRVEEVIRPYVEALL
jgi:predicted transcriptional regulator of viral defense system